MISPEDLALYRLTDRVEEAVAEILRFFRVYHSMRHVRKRTVLRLQQPLSPECLEEINRGFADMLESGRFVLSDPLPDEKDECDLAHLPRMVFAFNHRSFGRLRQLIDFVNAQVPVPRT